jgi:hypothetical protein
MFDHPLSEITPMMEDTPFGFFIANLPTRKGTFFPLQYIGRPLHDSDIDWPNFFERYLLRRKPKTEIEIRQMYGVMTVAKVQAAKKRLITNWIANQKRAPTKAEDTELNKKLIALGMMIPTPSAEDVAGMYSADKDYTYKELRTENVQEKAHSDRIQEIADDITAIKMEESPSSINEEGLPWGQIVKYIAVVAIVIGMAVIITKVLGLW